MSMAKKEVSSTAKGKNGNHPVAEAKSAGKTNKVLGSLVKCEVKLENGEWLSPASCASFKIDADAKFPEILYEVKTDIEGPYDWTWEIKWPVQACPQRRDRKRFKPKKEKTFLEVGQFTSMSRKWTANLNEKVIGGQLTVKVKAGSMTFVRKSLILGSEPGEAKIFAELEKYKVGYSKEAELAKKIFLQESKFHHFFSDDQPLVSFDNGYGLGQATEPLPSFEQAWSWKEHIRYIVTVVIKEKRKKAKKYLDERGGYTDDDLDMETLVYYNGAKHHYLVWNGATSKWEVNNEVLCDPNQSNTGWKISSTENKGKTLEQLRKGEGSKPSYTGRCYAEHIKKNQEAKK
jgi:hypothetical protein